MTAAARIAMVVVATVVLQTSVLGDVRIAGVAPELVLLVAVLTALVAGPDVGSVVGFAGGLLYDVFLETPLGLAAISYALTAQAIGSMRESLPDGDRRVTFFVGAAGMATGVAVFAALGEILGQATMSAHDAGKIIVVATAMSSVLIPVMFPIVEWMVEPLTRRRHSPVGA